MVIYSKCDMCLYIHVCIWNFCHVTQTEHQDQKLTHPRKSHRQGLYNSRLFPERATALRQSLGSSGKAGFLQRQFLLQVT